MLKGSQSKRTHIRDIERKRWFSLAGTGIAFCGELDMATDNERRIEGGFKKFVHILIGQMSLPDSFYFEASFVCMRPGKLSFFHLLQIKLFASTGPDSLRFL